MTRLMDVVSRLRIDDDFSPSPAMLIGCTEYKNVDQFGRKRKRRTVVLHDGFVVDVCCCWCCCCYRTADILCLLLLLLAMLSFANREVIDQWTPPPHCRVLANSTI
jgi:hypothetical protein